MLIERVVGQQQRPVGLLRVGLLRVLAHDDLAVEHRARFAAENALVDLVARAVRLGVIDGRVIVDQAIAIGQIQAVQRALRALSVEQRDRHRCGRSGRRAKTSAKRSWRSVPACTCMLAT